MEGTEKTEKPEAKGLSASLGLLHLISYAAYYLKIYSFQFPVMYESLKRVVEKHVFPSTFTLFSFKSCFQFHNNAFNQARVLKADVQRSLIFHSLYAHANTHACTGILYANAENRGVYLVSVYGAEY